MSKELNLLDKTIAPNKMILLLTWPTIIEQLLQILVNYVDTAMVGSIGVRATASIAVVTSTVWVIGGIMSGISVGFSVLISTHLGNGSVKAAKDATRQAFIVILAFGLFITLIVEFLIAPNLASWMGAEASIRQDSTDYFRIIGSVYIFEMFLFVGGGIIRGTGDTTTPMIYNIVNNIINIVGNYLLIYRPRTVTFFGSSFHMWGAGLGVRGAAWGTAIGAVISGVFMVSALFNKKSIVGISLRDRYRLDGGILRRVFNLGLPASMERIIISGGQLVVTALATNLGTSSLAAHQLANTAESICYMPVFAFGLSATTLVAQSLGAKDKPLAKVYAQGCIKQGLAVTIVAAICLYAFAPQLMGIFIRNTGVIAAGAAVLRIQAFAEPCVAISTVVSGVLRGGGDTKGPFFIAIIGMWMVRITMAIIMIRGFHVGLVGIWIPMACDWTARAICCLISYKRGRWLKNWL